MKRNTVKLTACCLTGMVLFGSQGIMADATELAGQVPAAGMEAIISEAYSAEEEVSISEHLTSVVNTQFENMVVSNVSDYVNIRKKADEESEAAGKLYKDSVATVLEDDGEWVKVESGSVTGYIRKEYLLFDEEAAEKAAEIAKEVATVKADTLKVRDADHTDAAVVALVANGQELEVKKETEEGWYKVKVDGETGYVSSEFVEVETVFKEAESKEEEEARKEKEAAKSAGGSGESGAVSSTGQSVASYAVQFVGNPYVWGGSSLTNGADCSGFVMAVYSNFGVGLPHSSSALRGSGRGVSYSEAQPGDIICYSGHVGIYIGGGQIVHASDEKSGIKISSATYTNILAVRRIF